MLTQATCQSLTSRSGTQGQGTSVSLVRYAKYFKILLGNQKMKKNKKNFQILFIFLLLLLLPYQIFSEENIETKEDKQSRKRLHIYSTPYTLNRYKYSSFRTRTEDFDLNVLL
ncbi:hypothetical protein ND812_13540, partial [Leptospira sp. 3 VSF25]|nr:hypothetical protein [Leptospira limi]